MPTPFIILDRDGVINYDSDNYIKSVEEWIPLPGSIEAISLLSKAGFSIVVATNQSGLARGYYDNFTLANMHTLMCNLVEEQGGIISGVFFCPHLPTDNCSCRKPLPGLLNQIESEFSTNLSGSWFVGDTEKDIDTALIKNCKPILVLTGKGRLTKKSLSEEKLKKIRIFDNLLQACNFIIKNSKININSGINV